MKQSARKRPVKDAATREAMRNARASHKKQRAKNATKVKPAATNEAPPKKPAKRAATKAPAKTIDSPSGTKTFEQLRGEWAEAAKSRTPDELREVIAKASEKGPLKNLDGLNDLRREVAEAELDRRTPKIPYHPLSQLLPMMSAEERTALRDSLKAHGQIDPIIRLDGQILDGRNRYEELLLLGIEPKFRDFDPKSDGDPVQFVIARATHRNMDDSQKACAAVKVKRALEGAAKERSKANLKQNAKPNAKKPWPIGTILVVDGGPRRVAEYRNGNVILRPEGVRRNKLAMPVEDLLALVGQPNPTEREPGSTSEEIGRSRDVAGQYFGVSGRYVQDAEYVLDNDPDLFDQVFNGVQKLTHARSEIRRRLRLKEIDAKAEKHAAAKVTGDELWEIAHGDCLKLLPEQPRRKVRLVVADPQYNIGYDYGEGGNGDKLTSDQYLAFCEKWIGECVDLLTDDGSAWVIISDEYAAEMNMLLKEAGLHMRAWVKWYETFGVNCANNFNRTSRHLFHFVRHPERFVFNPDAFKRPSDRQVKYADPRAHPNGKIWDDVWGINPPIPRLTDTCAERVPGIPTQLPLKLITPIVLGCSEPGDLVTDPFSGSGTTCVAAVTNGRRFYGTEINKEFAAFSRKRVQAALGSQTQAQRSK